MADLSQAFLDSCLAGGGEMGALMRAMDWSRTALGPVRDWPQSLRTSVSTCLNSRFPILIWWGPELVKIYNDAYRPILGAKHPKAMGQRGRECWPEIWHIIGPMLEGVLQRGEATWSENQLLLLERHGFAEECYFTFSYSPIRDESGNVGGVYCAVTETTRQVIGERRLRTLRALAAGTADADTAQEACRRAAEMLQQNLDDLPFAQIYLAPEDGGAPRLVASAGTVPADEEFCSQVAQALGGDAPCELASRRTLLLPFGAKEDVAGHLVAGLSPRLAPSDEYRGFLELVAGHLATAVANARRLHEAKRRAEALAQLDRAKTAFFSNVSHEFRTPLTLMLGPLEDALAAPARALAGTELQRAYRNALRVQKLVNALLDFSRIEAGRMRARFEPTDLAAVTTELASMFRSAAGRAGLELRVKCDPLPEPVYVDREMWETVVLNLLSNAFKFTFDGRIEVALAMHPGAVELSVRDTGIGIAPEARGRIFERFYSIVGVRPRTHEGSGIGLALVQELVRMHGGEIAVESELGVGTRFTVRLPRGRAHLPKEHIAELSTPTNALVARHAFVEEILGWLPQEEASAVAAAAPRSAEHGGARVLVVDDNSDMRDYIARLLRLHCDVATACDGSEALERLTSEPFDLVVSDVMMPLVDGFALLREMRADPRLASLPVILLSARAGAEARIEGLDAGADDYLVKPFSGRELVARVKSQLALAAARHARREAELHKQHLIALFSRAPNPILILRGERHEVQFANAAACQVWGRDPSQVVSRPLLEVLPELEGQVFGQLLDDVLKTGIPYEGKEVPARLDRGRDGGLQTVYFNFIYAPMRGLEGGVEGVLVLAFDVTEEVRAREEISRLRTASEAANLAKDEFLAMLGHELRNPLSPIVTTLQVMRLRGISSPELEILERQVGHVTRLVDDLLDVSRITRGKVELRKRPVELAEVLVRAMEMAGPLLEQRSDEVRVEVPAEGLVIDADPARMAQVLSNLLTNAAKYSEIGSRIEVRATRVQERVRIAVRDPGVGIAPEMLERVFDLFVQQPQTLARSAGGLGLGLAIVRNLVEMHGGTVCATSPGPGRGSEFVVELPALGKPAAPRAKRAPLARPAESGGKRILVVDDNGDAAMMLKLALENLGYRVETASDGPSALDKSREFRPEIALVDIGLPAMDGYELAQRMREQLGDADDLRLIALTGYGLEADRRRSEAAGFEHHFVKPVDLDQLNRVVAGRPSS